MVIRHKEVGHKIPLFQIHATSTDLCWATSISGQPPPPPPPTLYVTGGLLLGGKFMVIRFPENTPGNFSPPNVTLGNFWECFTNKFGSIWKN